MSDRITVISDTKFNGFSFNGLEYTWCQSTRVDSSLIIQDPKFAPNIVRVTNLERSIIDCLRRPSLSPDLSRLLRLSKSFTRQPDLAALVEQAKSEGTAVLFNRLGLYVECMADHWDIPQTTSKTLATCASRKPCEWNLTSPTHSGRGEPPSSEAEAHPSPERINFLKSKWRILDSSPLELH